MQLSLNFCGLALFVLALTGVGCASTPFALPNVDGAATVAADEPATYLVSHEQMMHWIATTDAELTFIGTPLNPLAPRSAQDTTVTYCSNRVDNVCGGPCTVYTGGATCLNAPNTNCLAATNNVGFCDRAGCGHSCNQLSTCGTRLDNGFCYTPGTRSILVSTA
ncbi:hypothetical protein GSI_14908 [Ganoderma sinense ZZ0214-1]|uniref:Uncharacterized protein n=1 Tax=Ganoderma sinense ZZ0214-1 TaxID=1077348 RepID=A0A2G8RQ01_9APHY|nr:hypothetical protein GSI_14908 [Ganoderma sinense ZZ0214-1]